MNSRLIRIVSLIVLSLFVMCSMAFAATDSKEWFWLNSDEKYSKYYSPSDVRTMQAFDGIAVKIRAWTKTTYSPGGAQETLENYNITDINPLDLSYSLAEVHINPQNRTLAYVQELFYDADGRVLWQKEYNPLRYKEMTSQEFDEDFYAFIVDAVFGQGEVERRSASDRWLLLWQEALADGGSVVCMADTTTMRVNGENIIFWEWQEYKNATGGVTQIRFMKKAVNLSQYTGKIIRYQHWNGREGWKDYTEAETDGAYHAIERGSTEEKELLQLSSYDRTHSKWVHRYSLSDHEAI